MKHVFVFDPKAFSKHQWKMDNILDIVGQFFRTQDKPDFSIQFSRYRRNAITIVQDEIEKAKQGDIVRVYAIGGEEIIFDCLNAVAHFPNMQLAIVPYGETNNFLKIFQVDKNDDKMELFRDIPNLINSDTLPTDVLRWDVNYALNSCYIGMNTATSKKVKEFKSSMNKSGFIILSKMTNTINYLFTAFNKQLAARQYNIKIDDLDYSGTYSLIHVANSPYHNGKKTGSSDATPDDGILNITLMKSAIPFTTLPALRRYAKGKKPRNCIIVQGKAITIHTKNPMWIQLDDEYIQDSNVSLTAVHHAIQIVVPAGLSYPIGSISAL